MITMIQVQIAAVCFLMFIVVATAWISFQR